MKLYLKAVPLNEMDCYENLVTFIVRFRLLIATLILSGTLFFAYFITTIKVDNDTFNSIPSTLKAKSITKDSKEFHPFYHSSGGIQFRTLSEKIDSLRSWNQEFSTLPGILNIADPTLCRYRGGFLV